MTTVLQVLGKVYIVWRFRSEHRSDQTLGTRSPFLPTAARCIGNSTPFSPEGLKWNLIRLSALGIVLRNTSFQHIVNLHTRSRSCFFGLEHPAQMPLFVSVSSASSAASTTAPAVMVNASDSRPLTNSFANGSRTLAKPRLCEWRNRIQRTASTDREDCRPSTTRFLASRHYRCEPGPFTSMARSSPGRRDLKSKPGQSVRPARRASSGRDTSATSASNRSS